MKTGETTNITQYDASKLQAFELRFMGYTYRQIAESDGMKYAETTLESYFAKGGLWREDYEEWVEKRKDDINDQVTGMFVAQALTATQAIANIIMDKSARDTDKLRAAENILDRGGFAAIQRVKNESESETVAEQILRGMEFIKKQDKAEVVENEK